MPKVKANKLDLAQKTKLSQFISKGKEHKAVKRANQHVFEGFYERLTKIDVKHGHSSLSEANHKFDTLLNDDYGTRLADQDQDDMANSNFIQLLKAEKFNNQAPEFTKIFKDVEKLSFSYPLLILNKSAVLSKLIAYLDEESMKVVKLSVLDLIIALIKDMRSQIYEDFLNTILPKVISLIDSNDLQLLEKSFQLLSLAFKYLLKPIKENIGDVYLVYFELLRNKNRFVRKFTAQSFSYVLRKINIDQDTIKMIFEPLSDSKNEALPQNESEVSKEQEEKVLGIVDLIFEAISGHGEEIHSKGMPMLTEILKSDQIEQSAPIKLVVRYLFLKLVNEIDTSKQLPLFEALTKNLPFEQPAFILLVAQIFKQSVQLKHGRRVDQLVLLHMIQTLNNLILKKQDLVVKLDHHIRKALASTLGHIFYFKHSGVLRIFQSSGVAFSDGKSTFTSGLFSLDPVESTECASIQAFYELVLQRPDNIQTKMDGISQEKALIIKNSNQIVHFSEESHQEKTKLLIKPLARQLLKELGNNAEKRETWTRISHLMALLMWLIHNTKEKFEVQLQEKASLNLIKMILEGDFASQHLFVVAQFVSKCQNNTREVQAILSLQNQNQGNLELNAENMVSENPILSMFQQQGSLITNKFSENLQKVIDLTNEAYRGTEWKNINILLGDQGTKFDPSSLLSLKMRQDSIKKEIGPEFELLCQNLCKNNSQLRLQTLEYIIQTYKSQDYKPFDVEKAEKESQNLDQETVKKLYTGPCPILKKLIEYEKLKPGFENQKARDNILRYVNVIVQSGLVPDAQIQATFYFMIGSLWIRFTPSIQPAIQILESILQLSHHKDLIDTFLSMFESVTHATQICQEIDNDVLMVQIQKYMSNKVCKIEKDSDIFDRYYALQTSCEKSWVTLKDFQYNMTRTLFETIDLVISNVKTQEKMFQIYNEFYNIEFIYLTKGRQVRNESETDLKAKMMRANLVDSDDFKARRKIAYAKLSGFVELFSKAGQLKKLGEKQSAIFIEHMLELLNTSDSTLQKNILHCLLKCSKKQNFANKTLKLPKYEKLLFGLTDDLQFKDMIPVINFGQSEGTSNNATIVDSEMIQTENDQNGDSKMANQSKKAVKGSIQKLAKEDRQEVLPVIIKLLFSKMLKKQGAINRKSIHTRRNIVYQFLSGLDPQTEFHLFFRELLQPLGISHVLDPDSQEFVSKSQWDQFRDQVKQKLSGNSFGVFTSFIAQLEVVFKQLVSLLRTNNYLQRLSKVLIYLLSLTRQFSGQIREQVMQEANQDVHMQNEENEQQQSSTTVYKFVGQQAKMVQRKGLQIISSLFSKFSHLEQFMGQLSADFYTELVEDQLSNLSEQFVSEQSSLVEILTLKWSNSAECFSNYTKFGKVVPAILQMLRNKKLDSQVAFQIMSMVKNIVLQSLEKTEREKKKSLLEQKIKMELSDEEMESSFEGEDLDVVVSTQDKPGEIQKTNLEIAQDIIRTNLTDLAQSLSEFWANNQKRLDQCVKGGRIQSTARGTQSVPGSKVKEHMEGLQTLRDMTFALSELSKYFSPEQHLSDVSNFLQMLVQFASSRVLLKSQTNSQSTSSYSGDQRATRNEELLKYACQAICALLKTICLGSDLNQEDQVKNRQIVEKIALLCLNIESRKVRMDFCSHLSTSLSTVPNSPISPEILDCICDMNMLKKGFADEQLDFEKVLAAIQRSKEVLVGEKVKETDKNILLYNLLFLLQSEEYSVREYAQHALTDFITSISQTTFRITENWLVETVKMCSDELVLKSILGIFRHMIKTGSEQEIEFSLSKDLYPLLSLGSQQAGENGNDFFDQLLSMQMNQRSKALRRLAQITDKIPSASFRRAVLPLVDFLIFDSKNQLQNKRNTVRYTKQQTTQLMEDALNVYQSYASHLRWNECFKLIRKMLYKVEKATRKTAEYSAEREDHEMEKTVTKCLCKVLDGLSQNETINLPDAITKIQERASKRKDNKRPNEFSKMLEELAAISKNDEEMESSDEDVESDKNEVDSDNEEAGLENQNVIIADRQLKEQNEKKDAETSLIIQRKLQRKVLPVLLRHLQERPKKASDQSTSMPVRSYVAVSVAKVIRKLPMQLFRSQLRKLINALVVKGLRVGDLNLREKARKSLLRVIGEVSPAFLSLIFQEMQDQLTKGYQLHVHLYTVHYLLNHLSGQNKAQVDESLSNILQPGQITSQMISFTSDLLLREQFGDLFEERMLTDTQKKHIKESKARKALPIYEVFTEYIDFQDSFLDLIAPINKVLEQNPTFAKIAQCEEVLGKISTSLLKNKTVNADQLLIFLFSITQQGINMTGKTKINDEKAVRDFGAKADSDFFRQSKEQLMADSHGIQMQWVKTNQHVSSKKTMEVCGRVLANFGLQCLRKSLKKRGLILSGDEHEQRAKVVIDVKQELRDKLDPFVLLLLGALKTFYNPMIVTTLHIMIHVIHLGLPSFQRLLKRFLNKIFKLFQNASDSDNEFLNTLFHCVTELIRTYSVYNDLSELQLKTLILIIKTNIGNFGTQNHVFSCLKAIVSRKFLCSDLYDLMEIVEDMMVTSISKSTRQVCSSIFIQFLLEYPLEEKRVTQHVNSMLKNLTYFDVEGRMQLLDNFSIVIDKFPKELLDKHAELFFLTFFLRMINDQSAKCREKVVIVLKKLLQKTSLQRQLLMTTFKLAGSVVSTNSDEIQTEAERQKQDSMLAGKLQLIQLFAEVGRLQQSDISQTLHFVSEIISEHAKRTLRKSLLFKFNKDQEDLETAQDFKAGNSQNEDFLRAIDLGESDIEDQDLENNENKTDSLEEMQGQQWSNAYVSLKSIDQLMINCEMTQVIACLESTGLSESLISDIVGLSWRHQHYWVRFTSVKIIGRLLEFNDLNPQKCFAIFESIANTSEQRIKMVYQTLHQLNLQIYTDDLATRVVSNVKYIMIQELQNVEESSTLEQSLRKMVNKASFIGRKILGSNDDAREERLYSVLKIFLQTFEVIKQKFDKYDCSLTRHILKPILELVFRTSTDSQVCQEVKDLSAQILDLLAHTMDKQYFVTEYNQVQMDVARNRTERKIKQKTMVATEEGIEAKARRRIHKTIKKKEKHKEKVFKHMMLRGKE